MKQAFFERANPKYREVAEMLDALITEELQPDQPVKVGDTMISYGEGTDGHQLVGIAVRSAGAMLYAGAGILDKHMETLGKKRTGKVCLRLRRKDEVPETVLRDIIAAGLAAEQMDYGC